MKKIVFKNGIEKILVEVKPDFKEAQKILDLSEYTNIIDVESAYEKRSVGNNFEGTYRIMVDRYDNYNQFISKIEEIKIKEELRIKKEIGIYSLFDLFDRVMTKDVEYSYYQKTRDELYQKLEEIKAKNKILNFAIPSFEEWKSNKLENGQRLAKAMRKAGFPNELLDYYSAQVKTEKEVYFTITSLPQFIAGMSYYSPGNWDGMGGKSCQCPEIGERYAVKLAGSLHDDKLFVGLLHYDLNDVYDMKDKLQARTVLRYVSNLKGAPALISTRYYGNNETKDLMNECLKRLEEVTEIYSNEVLCNHDMAVEEAANGAYELPIFEEVYINEWYTVDEYVNVECPMCEGYGDYELWIDEIEDTHTIECPACHGRGEIQVNVYEDVYVDEYVDVEVTQNVLPYFEDYAHYGYKVIIKVNGEYIDRVRSKRELELIEG